MFLTNEEIEQLTDYKMPHKQCEWLNAHGYQFDVSRSGKPKVLKSFIENRLGQITNALLGQQPNFDALG